jgi:DNA-3-methyladenine glycosylase II
VSEIRIDNTILENATEELKARVPVINDVVSRLGLPPLWIREPGFASLVYTILEQQVSLASARATYLKLVDAVNELTPADFLRLGDDELRAIGFSRQKSSYCRILAHLIIKKELDLEALSYSPDSEVRETLQTIKGIGPWTADIYLLHSLGRVDIWPTGDLALRIGVQEAMGLDERPTDQYLNALGDSCRPWRSVATRVFWHFYLSKRNSILV